MSNRACNGCAACCFTHAVASINKPTSEWCPHCNHARACNIYQKRPNECREFRCEWLKGFGEDSHRPNLMGYVLDFVATGPLGSLFQVYEVKSGAMVGAALKEAKRFALERNIPVFYIYRSGKKEFFVPITMTMSTEIRLELLSGGVEIIFCP